MSERVSQEPMDFDDLANRARQLDHCMMDVMAEEVRRLTVAMMALRDGANTLSPAEVCRVCCDALKEPRREGLSERSEMEAGREVAALKAEVEQERVRLAGCGVAAMGNTPDSVAQRAKPGDYGWSASYGDVCRAVDREMSLRAEVERLKADREWQEERALNNAIAAEADLRQLVERAVRAGILHEWNRPLAEGHNPDRDASDVAARVLAEWNAEKR